MEKTENTKTPQVTEDPSIIVNMSPEEYLKLRRWIQSGDFIEVATGPGEGKTTLINSRKLDQKNHPALKDVLGGELLDFRIRLLSPFTDFIESYLSFFNEPSSLEAFIVRAVYEKVWQLHHDLTQFVKAKGHQLELQGWLEKYPERIHGNEDEENEEEK